MTTAKLLIDTPTDHGDNNVWGPKLQALIAKVDKAAKWSAYERGCTGVTAAADTAALVLAVSDCAAAGGGTVLLPEVVKLNAKVTIPNKVDVIGLGSAQGGGGTLITCTTAAAQLAFGDTTGGSSGGVSGGFTIDGAQVANNPLYVGEAVGRSFHNIDSINGVVTNLICEATQNCLFMEVNLQGAASGLVTTDGFRIDKGAATNCFVKCEFGISSRYHADFTHSGAVSGLVNYPNNNTFLACIFEYEPTTTTGTAMIHGGAGVNNRFLSCTVVSSGASGSPPILLKLDNLIGGSSSGAWVVEGGTWQFNAVLAGSIAFDIGNGTSLMVDAPAISGATTGFQFPSSPTGTVTVIGEPIYTGVTNQTAGPAFAAQALMLHVWNHPLVWTRPSAETALFLRATGDSGNRLQLDALGDLFWGSGTGAVDQALQRISATVMKFLHKVTATDGIGVGNSVAKTTLASPGTVTKMIEVFDASGASLGAVPVYALGSFS